MQFVVQTIIHAQIVVIVIVLVSYIIEKISFWKLFIYMFTRPKDIKKSTAASDFHAGLYFVICLLTLLYDFYKNKEYVPKDYAFWKWLIIMIPLVIIFQKLYYKFTTKDPNRSDDDWD